MPEVLDQTEVDELLSAIDTGEIEEAGLSVEPLIEEREVSIYDFKRPERVSKEQLRAITALHEGFARNFRASLSGFMRTIVEVDLSSVEQITYSQFILSLPNPTCFVLLIADPLEGSLALEINPTILFPIIDRLLGGSQDVVTIPERPLTDIEFRLANRIMGLAIQQLDEMWGHVLPGINFTVERTESNPHLAQMVAPNEPVVLVSVEVSLGEHSGMISICLPYGAIEPILADMAKRDWFSSKSKESSPKARRLIERGLKRAILPVSSYLARTTVTVRELLDLKVGDILTTDSHADDDIFLEINGRLKYVGKPGQYRGKYAFMVGRATTVDEE